MVKVLNREQGKRMWGGKSNVYGVSGGGTGGGDVDLSSYATMAWTKQNFVSIEYFRTLFRAFDSNDDEILPNNTTSIVDNIKAMVGLWTEQYLTALGNQSGGGGGGGGAQYLNDLLDVQLTTPLTDGQALVYNATLQKWVNGAAGVNMTTVWNALAGSTNEQINASHLSTALSGYVTTSAISDMATQTWVGQQGFATQTWVTSNFITIAYFDRLFRVYNGNTLVSHNDTTTTIDNIKAMFGFWTDFYLSALGTGGISTVGIGLSQLNDVTLTSPTGGQALVYDATSNKWVNGTIQTGVSSLSSLSDVLLSSLQTNQVLIYDSFSAKWVNTSLKTINSQSIIGSGDISVGGGASGNYLPLTGGTLNGSQGEMISVKTSVSSSYITFYPNNSYKAGIGFDGDYAFFSAGSTGDYAHIILDNNGKPKWGYYSFSQGASINYNILYDTISGATINGDLNVQNIVTSRYSIFPNEAYIYPGLIFADTQKTPLGELGWYQDHFTIGNYYGRVENCYALFYNDGHVLIGGQTTTTYRLVVEGMITASSFAGGEQDTSYSSSKRWNIGQWDGSFLITVQSLSSQFISTGISVNLDTNYVGIGLANPSYKLHVSGDVYATGGVTALSDIRHKTIIKDAAVSVEDIARMPAVMYQWNDGREDKELHVGSIAQNWQTVLPEVVLKANDGEGTLSMQYGVAALVSSIIIARKVVNHEQRIKQLEKENKELKERLKIA